jgi:hypothetical protein
MPDISMCANKACPSRMSCYRYRAKPSGDRQSWIFYTPEAGRDRCDRFAVIYAPEGDHLTPIAELP